MLSARFPFLYLWTQLFAVHLHEFPNSFELSQVPVLPSPCLRKSRRL